MKKNVLFVVDERCMGGISILLDDMLHMLDISNLNIDVLILHNRGTMLNNLPKEVNILYGTKYFSTIDLNIHEVLKSKNLITIFRKFRTIFDLKTGLVKKRILKERKKMNLKHYDYEIAFKDGYTAIFTAVADSDIKYHWIQYDYKISNPNARYDKLMKEVLPKFNKIISVSEGIKNDFNSIYNMGNKVEIIDNLVNIERIKSKSNEECNIVLNPTETNIICVGRLSNHHKGFDRLITIIGQLNSEGLFNNTILRIYGDGPDRQALEHQINQLNLQNKVILQGQVDNPYKYYKNNDLFILPSRYEAFGLVIVEALALNVPVLVTKNAATKNLVDSKYGIIVENTDAGIYEGLKDLLLHKEKLTEFKNNLKNYEYSNINILNKLQSLFK